MILIYNRALTPTEIAYNYNHPETPVLNGLVLWLRFDEPPDETSTVYDASGYGNHGTIYGATRSSDVPSGFSAGIGIATYEFKNSTNHYYGLQNLNRRWYYMFNPNTGEFEYTWFVPYRLTGLKVSANHNEEIRFIEATYEDKDVNTTEEREDRFTYPDWTKDSNGDGVPDAHDAIENGLGAYAPVET